MTQVLCLNTFINVKKLYPTTKAELQTKIEKGLSGLIEVRDAVAKTLNRTANCGPGGYHILTATYGEGLKLLSKSPGGISLYTAAVTAIDNNVIDEALKLIAALDGVIRRQSDALDSVIADNKCVGLVIVDNVDLSKSYNQISVAKTTMAAECPECGHLIHLSGVNSHRGSLKCLQATNDRDLREAGWIQMDYPTYTSAIKKAGIKYDIRATGFTMWVPRWVDDAIKQYQKNSGYGGMTLPQYLEKMKPHE